MSVPAPFVSTILCVRNGMPHVVAELFQSEIDRRDRIIAEKNDWWSNEVCRRDVIIDGLRQEQEWMRSGWRRFIIRRPAKPASTPRE